MRLKPQYDRARKCLEGSPSGKDAWFQGDRNVDASGEERRFEVILVTG